MKINRIPSSNVINQYIHLRENTPVNNKPSQSTDMVELTKDSKTFSAALKQAKASISVRTPKETEHINEVASQVKEGSYAVTGEEVAAKMLGID